MSIEADIDKLFANIRDSALNGIWRENNVSSDLNWTFGRSFFFAATLITTIGTIRLADFHSIGRE